MRAGPPGARRSSPVLLAATACAVGFACGEMVTRRGPAPLAPAGSARDDGSGWLARMSSRAALGRPGDGRTPAPGAYGGARYGGQSYGGATYGAATYGGTLYGNYQAPGLGPAPDPPGPYRAGYVGGPVGNGGAVEGTVVWPDAPRAPERIAAGRGTCAGAVRNPTLAVGAGHAVANAVVYLEDITRGRLTLGRTWPYPPTRIHQVGGALEWRACRLRPQLQLAAPIGSLLSVTSADAALTLVGTRIDGARREPMFTARLASAGAAREIQLGRDGFVEVTPEAGGGGGAWIVAAPHPYYVVSDERGRFVLDEIPPGSYTMVVWHQPVVTGVRPGGEPIVTAAAVVKRRVTVKAGQRQRMVVRLPSVR